MKDIAILKPSHILKSQQLTQLSRVFKRELFGVRVNPLFDELVSVFDFLEPPLVVEYVYVRFRYIIVVLRVFLNSYSFNAPIVQTIMQIDFFFLGKAGY